MSTAAPLPKSRRLPELLTPVAALLLLALVVWVRLRYLGAPLERDEGEYAYMGQLLLKGIAPFTLAYSMKPPGVAAVYALFLQLFGHGASAIRCGLLLVNLISIGLVYLLARRFFDRHAALVSAACFGMLSLSRSFLGIFAHATHFVVLFALAGFLLLLIGSERQRLSLLFASGLCLGLACCMKQHAVVFVAGAALQLALGGGKSAAAGSSRRSGLLLLLAGAALPYLLMATALWWAGVWPQFWLWTVLYAREYVSQASPAAGLAELAPKLPAMLLRQLPFWLAALWGGIVAGRRPASGDTGQRFLLPGLLLCSLAAVLPGWYFREHYFIVLLPAIALYSGAAAAAGMRRPGAATTGMLLLAAVVYGAVAEGSFFFGMSPPAMSRALYGKNPFPEAAAIGRYLQEHTTADERIAILGSEPEIYFYADRLSATGFIYMYSLMENQPYADGMQRQMIGDLQRTLPAYIVMVRINSSWGGKPGSSTLLLRWGERLLAERYQRVGVVDILGNAPSRILWDDDARGYEPVSTASVTIHRLLAPANGPDVR